MTLSDNRLGVIVESDTERLLGQILARLNALEQTVGEIKQDQREIRQELSRVYEDIKNDYVTAEAFEPIKEMRVTMNRLAFAVVMSVIIALIGLVVR